MRVLLDECLPRRLKQSFGSEHEVTTVPERGWAGTKNGELLSLADSEFEVFVTVDAGISLEQGTSMTIVLLRASSNRLESLLPLMPTVLGELATASRGQVLRIGGR